MKIIEITSLADKCSDCRHLIEDELINTMNSLNMTSLREDTVQKIIVIPSLQIRRMMAREDSSTFKMTEIEEEVKKPQLSKSEFGKENSNLMGGVRLSTRNSLKLGISNEKFDLDENIGSAEYYQYLVKTVS